MKRTKKHSIEFLLKSIVTTSALLFLSINTCFAGHKNYFLKTTVDYGGFGLLYEIVTDDGNGGGGTNQEYAEEALGYHFEKVKHYGNICNKAYDSSTNTNHLTINFNANRGTPTERAEQYKELQEGQNDTALVFSFPGLKDPKGYNATSNDYTRASQTGETLVTGLNQAILFMRNNSDSDLVSKHSLHLLLGKISYTSELSKNSSFSISLGSPATKFTITRADTVSNVSKELIPINGLNYSDYVQIKVESGSYKGNYSYFPWRMNKGYFTNVSGAEAVLQKYVGSAYSDASKANENEYLTWGQLILQAMLSNDVKGTSEQDFATDVQTIIGQGLGSDLTATISSVRSLLGLSSMSELVLNMGSRPSNYHMGVMSKDMHNIALTVYTLNLMISLTFIGFMIVKMIHQKMLATTNIVAKTTLMEGIKDLIFVAVMLGFFAPLFETLLELNFLIVRTFSYSSEYMATFTALGNKSLSMESMAGFMVSSMFLSIDVYINFVYLVRAITVSFLFAISPIIIVSYLWSPAQKNLVFGFFRELVGNIFMQSFHAITMTFFSAYNMSNMSSIEALASAYCFVPITQLFRQLVLGNSGGFSEKVGGKLAGQMTSTAMGLNKSAMQAKHSKDMFTKQAEVQADIAKAERNGNVLTAGLSTVAGAVGMLGGPAVSALASGVVSAIGTYATGEHVAGVTKEAMGELGSLQAKQADQMVGMGLAELGVGLGISSYDGAGDRMVASGLATVQSGAMMKGQAESRAGEGGQYMADASQYAIESRGYSQAIMQAGRAGQEYASEKTKAKRMYKDMETRHDVQKQFNSDYEDELRAMNRDKMIKDSEDRIAVAESRPDLATRQAELNLKTNIDANLNSLNSDEFKKSLHELDKAKALNQFESNKQMHSDEAFVNAKVDDMVNQMSINDKAQLESLSGDTSVKEALHVAKNEVTRAGERLDMNTNKVDRVNFGVEKAQESRLIEGKDMNTNSQQRQFIAVKRAEESRQAELKDMTINQTTRETVAVEKREEGRRIEAIDRSTNAGSISANDYAKYEASQQTRSTYEANNAGAILAGKRADYAQSQAIKNEYEDANSASIQERDYRKLEASKENQARYNREHKQEVINAGIQQKVMNDKINDGYDKIRPKDN